MERSNSQMEPASTQALSAIANIVSDQLSNGNFSSRDEFLQSAYTYLTNNYDATSLTNNDMNTWKKQLNIYYTECQQYKVVLYNRIGKQQEYSETFPDAAYATLEIGVSRNEIDTLTKLKFSANYICREIAPRLKNSTLNEASVGYLIQRICEEHPEFNEL